MAGQTAPFHLLPIHSSTVHCSSELAMETADQNSDSISNSEQSTALAFADGDESPESTGEDESTVERSSCDALAKGISSMLGSVLRDFDSRAQATLRSQEDLTSSIDRLTEQLDQLLEDAPSPFIMQHAARISSVRKRVSSLNAVLRSIQRRVDNMDRMLFVGLPLEKSATERGSQS